jgi:hypothetical protein
VHILPVHADVAARIFADSFQVVSEGDAHADFKRAAGRDYLYYRGPESAGKLYVRDELPSQYMRMILGEAVGRDLWQWQDYLMLSPAEEVRSRLEASRILVLHALTNAGAGPADIRPSSGQE